MPANHVYNQERALAIYHDYEKARHIPLRRYMTRYNIAYQTLVSILTAQHQHTRHLPPIYEVR